MRPALVLTVAALAACSGPNRDPVFPVGGSGEPQVGAPTDPVKLVERGASPRRRLRYRFSKGTVERIEMDMKMAMTITVGDSNLGKRPRIELPTIRSAFRVETLSLANDGTANVAFTLERMQLLADANIAAAGRDRVDAELAKLEGFVISATISPRGQHAHLEYKLPPQAPPSIAQQLDTMRDGLQHLFTALPGAEVGDGAAWDIHNDATLNGMRIQSTYGYRLAGLAADGAKLDVSVDMSAPAQDIQIPGAGPAHIASMSGSGHGTLDITMTSLIPAGSIQLQSTATFEAASVTSVVVNDIVITVRRAR